MFPKHALLYSRNPHQPALYMNTVSFSSAGRTHSSGPAGEAKPTELNPLFLF